MTSLQAGRVADDYGREENATLEVTTDDPAGVTQEELDFYSDVWPHLDVDSLFFYLFPVLRALAEGKAELFIDPYFNSLATWWPIIHEWLTEPEIREVRRALRLLYEHGDSQADWDLLEPIIGNQLDASS